mmetsp:Transcript_5138/g.7774  ORF Transcript_5138/g.7774 Transcript_5138/m.7774 type:complete len:135 (+) Transcript_5138:224-628(+)
MQVALSLARHAMRCGEVPVGAVVMRNGFIIGYGYNQTKLRRQSYAHAEMLAISMACKNIGSERLSSQSTQLYVTLEPCMMCLGCAIESRISQILFATKRHNSNQTTLPLHHDTTYQNEARHLLQSFFQSKRNKH